MRTRGFLGMALVCVAMLACAAEAAQVKMSVDMAKPTLFADKKHNTYLKVALTGFSFKDASRRTPVNLAIVIDKSGSMSGQKIRKAREAAIMAVSKLTTRDIVSVVAYDHTVRVLVPATKVTETVAITNAINRLSAGGNTALFAGVSKGAAEVRKFLDKTRAANRVILLSDGLANVGPSCPAELGSLGASLIKEGVSVTTIGLGGGYNEDLMMQLARRSDGNHYFVEGAPDLVRIFKAELGDVLSVCAQEVTIRIKCAPGIRPVRALGRDAEIAGQTVTTVMNQLYSEQEKYVMLEVEVPAGKPDTGRKVADVEITYANMATKTTETLASNVSVRFSKSAEVVRKSVKAKVMVAVVELIATDNNRRALVLADQGKFKEAQVLLLSNGTYLKSNAAKFGSQRLYDYGAANHSDGMNVIYFDAHLEADFGRSDLRKDMRAWQHYNDFQQKTK